MSTPRATNPKLVFLEAPWQELSNGLYPTLCDHWKPSYVDLKFWVAHLLRERLSPGVGHPSSGKNGKWSAREPQQLRGGTLVT